MNISQYESFEISKTRAMRCKRLLWSVVTLAVEDACRVPDKLPAVEAMTAMRFIFGNGSRADIDSYFHWLDINGNFFRKRLLESMYAETHSKFLDSDRRAFRANYNWYMPRQVSINQLLNEGKFLQGKEGFQTVQQMQRKIRKEKKRAMSLLPKREQRKLLHKGP